ncbi:MAG: hypothetical protein R3B51_05370 [Thermodesulfobacteriota bacterium]
MRVDMTSELRSNVSALPYSYTAALSLLSPKVAQTRVVARFFVVYIDRSSLPSGSSPGPLLS